MGIYPSFQDGGRLPFWIIGANFGATHNENLMVFITMQIFGCNRISHFDNAKNLNILHALA